MKKLILTLALITALSGIGCATPPTADPSKAEPACAQQCSSSLAECGSGFKLFPVVQQKQCNDNYDICINGCPAREADTSTSKSTAGRLEQVDALFNSGAITKEEYEEKRKEILNAL